jgi:hypothetical protein
VAWALWDLPDTVACPGLELEVRRSGRAGYYCCLVVAVVAMERSTSAACVRQWWRWCWR